MSTTTITEWDVRKGLVYRNGQAIIAFHDYHLVHPDGNTIEQWEASMWARVYRLAYGTWPHPQREGKASS